MNLMKTADASTPASMRKTWDSIPQNNYIKNIQFHFALDSLILQLGGGS